MRKIIAKSNSNNEALVFTKLNKMWDRVRYQNGDIVCWGRVKEATMQKELATIEEFGPAEGWTITRM